MQYPKFASYFKQKNEIGTRNHDAPRPNRPGFTNQACQAAGRCLPAPA